MRRREVLSVTLVGLGLGACGGASALRVNESEAVTGVRAALERGAAAAVSLLGVNDGFLGNPRVRIALPQFLRDASRLLKATGQQHRVEALEVAMNRAAEAAVPEARALLLNAVRQMSVEDAHQLITGGDNAVTRFFEAKTREPLGQRFLPIVTRATERVSLAAKYNAVAGPAANLGFLKPQESSIESYVTGKALDGLFFMIGEEERKIRADPVATGSAILRKVFGGLK